MTHRRMTFLSAAALGFALSAIPVLAQDQKTDTQTTAEPIVLPQPEEARATDAKPKAPAIESPFPANGYAGCATKRQLSS